MYRIFLDLTLYVMEVFYLYLFQLSDTDDSATSHHHQQHNKLSNKKKEKLTNESQRLSAMKSEISHENRSLKKRVVSLETQVCLQWFSNYNVNIIQNNLSNIYLK